MSYDIKFKKRTIEYLKSVHTHRKTAEILGFPQTHWQRG